MQVDKGVAELMLQSNPTSDLPRDRWFFEGDQYQVIAAKKAAITLGIQTGVEGGLPFVTSQEDFERVTKYLIEYRISGWQYYATAEEYCQIKGGYPFTGHYLECRKEIRQIADDLGIRLKSVSDKILFATSKEDYDAIIELADKYGIVND